MLSCETACPYTEDTLFAMAEHQSRHIVQHHTLQDPLLMVVIGMCLDTAVPNERLRSSRTRSSISSATVLVAI